MNIVKHAGTSRASVSLCRGVNHLEVTVGDEGRGFSDTVLSHSAGLGMFSLREQIESLGGAVTIDSSPGRGTRVSFTVPGAASGEESPPL